MKLLDLIKILPEKAGAVDATVEISGIKHDSRQVEPGDLFVAIRGTEVDGHRFIPHAVSRGAAAVLCEVPPETRRVPVVTVPDTRRALPLIAAQFYGHPSKQLRLIGVTGTNGKTTTTNLIRRMLVEAGHRTALLGTINTIVCDMERPSKLTTPESLDLQEAFRDMVNCGTSYAVMEVSSHALALHRVDSCEFDVGVFTNLTQDHLDYHQTMENYREAKATLFRRLGSTYFGEPKAGAKAGVINVDDPTGEYMRTACSVRVITYGIQRPADVSANEISFSSAGSRFVAETPMGKVEMRLLLAGRINIYNALAAMSVAAVEGIPLSVQKAALESVPPIPGRFERVDAGQKFFVVVDYAHSPDGLLNVLRASRDMSSGKVIVVFGCGGDRDRKKRPIMGRIAGELADLAIITTDNPRSEDPETIIDEIEAGIKETPPRLGYRREVDRASAIRQAIFGAGPGDVVLIAGKGHENYQIFRDRTIHFDDREVAREVLAELRLTSPDLFKKEG